VVGEHGDTQAAYSAMILLAAKQWQEGQQDTAIETLRKFIAASPKHPALPTARAGLASKLMAQGKTAESAEIFQSLIDDPNARFIAPFALIALGDMSYVAGDTERAEFSTTASEPTLPTRISSIGRTAGSPTSRRRHPWKSTLPQPLRWIPPAAMPRDSKLRRLPDFGTPGDPSPRIAPG
jgi:hypothetical protein